MLLLLLSIHGWLDTYGNEQQFDKQNVFMLKTRAIQK
jgi:hypothetical protein